MISAAAVQIYCWDQTSSEAKTGDKITNQNSKQYFLTDLFRTW